MKQYLSMFSIDDDIKSNQKRSTRQDYDIIDLFNRNRDAIMQYQAHESSSADKQAQMSVSKLRYSRNLSQEDEMALWFQSKADEVMEKDLYSDFFYGIESAEINGTDNLGKSDNLHPRPNLSSSIVNLPAGGKECHQLNLISERSQKDEHEATITTSTGGSGCSSSQMGHQFPGYQNQKRKGRDGQEHECQSKETDFEQREAEKPLQLSKSARRSRAAEVHNLSERRRRDRINEKMKALKELLPHCNKSDKASMLDDAIEYLKSLQLQLQFMWMASGMAPTMFPAAQHYMSQMSIQAGHAHMLSLHGTTQPAARTPTFNQSNTTQTTTCTSSDIDNVVNFASQMQPNPQAMNQYDDGSHKMQQNQTAGLECNGGLPVDREIPPNNLWKDIC